MTVIDEEFDLDLDLRLLRTPGGPTRPVDVLLLAEFDLDVRLGELTRGRWRMPVDAATDPIGIPTRGLGEHETCNTENDTCAMTCAGHHTCPNTECDTCAGHATCPDTQCDTCEGLQTCPDTHCDTCDGLQTCPDTHCDTCPNTDCNTCDDFTCAGPTCPFSECGTCEGQNTCPVDTCDTCDGQATCPFAQCTDSCIACTDSCGDCPSDPDFLSCAPGSC